MMRRRLLLFLSDREQGKDLLLHLPFARRAAARFVAGETLGEALAVAERLNGDGFEATLDYLGESVSDLKNAAGATEAYLESLDAIASSPARSTISLKLTQLGLDVDEEACAAHLRRIVEHAAQVGNFVRIDMEGSAHTERTLRIFRRVYTGQRNIGIVIQSYLRRSAADIEELLRLGAPVRLCKGAYDEPATIAFRDKKDVDRNYVRLMKRLVEGGAPTAIATHDERMIDATLETLKASGVPAGGFEFQMLYGVRRELQRRLIHGGQRVRIYVPYGREWYSYFMRRMAERPANLWFVIRAMLGD